jgi:ribonuclease BN (tRNA processing enzyme)
VVDDRAESALVVTVLGCSGTYAGPGGACSGYLVRGGGATIVVDLGAGSLANLQRHVDLGALDAVVLSHEHPDHWLDLPILRNALRYVLDLGGLPVFGTAGTNALVRGVMGGDLAPTLLWGTVDETSTLSFGDLSLRFSRTDHPVETLAVRVDADGRSLLYSADTGPAWEPGPAGEGVDAFLCEASLRPEDEDTFEHLSGAQAGRLARGIGAGRLVLTHVVPGVDAGRQAAAASGAFGGPVEVAVTGATIVP